MITIPTSEFRRILLEAPSISAVASQLGVTTATVRRAARRHYLAREALACGARGARCSRLNVTARTNLVDMTGCALAGVLVIARAHSSESGKGRWLVRHAACGHDDTHAGPNLREVDRKGGKVRCRVCRGLTPSLVAYPKAPDAPKWNGQHGVRCSCCAGLRHLAARDGCPCGNTYAPERRPTIEESMAAPRDDRRVW